MARRWQRVDDLAVRAEQAGMPDTVLVTGAGGFVGSAVVRRFVDPPNGIPPRFWDGASVSHTVALLRPGGSTERLHALPRNGAWSIERVDIADRPALRVLLRRIRPRAILHLAVDPSVHGVLSDAERQRVNDGPLETLFEGLAGVSGARFVNTGSAWVLRAGTGLDEDAPVEPRSVYAENKVRIDRLLPILSAGMGVDWINLRLFNIFGPYERTSRLLPSLVINLIQGKAAALSSGSQVRDFNYLDVIADAYRSALEAGPRACGAVYHIGSGVGTSTRDFALMVAQMIGNAHLIRFGAIRTPDQDLPCLVADSSRAQRVLKWAPGVDLEGRVRKTVEWWLERLGRAGAAAVRRDPAPSLPLPRVGAPAGGTTE